MQSGLTPASAPASESSPTTAQIAQWLDDARAGSRSALGRALEAGRKYLLTIANQSLDAAFRDKVAPSDLVQDTFVEAQRDFERFQGTTEGELLGWLTAILANRVSNTIRRYRRTLIRDVGREIPRALLDAPLVDNALTPAAAAIAWEEERRVRDAMAQLDESDREILLERNWKRTSFAEIGAARGCSAEAARKAWSRAVRHLKKILDDTR